MVDINEVSVQTLEIFHNFWQKIMFIQHILRIFDLSKLKRVRICIVLQS